MIVSVLVVGGWLGWIVRHARIEGDAAAAIVRAGGWVKYDSGSTYVTTPFATPLGASSGRWDTIGENYFAHVSNAGFNHEIPDRDLAEIGRLHALVCLSLNDTNVNDRGLAHLEGLTCLSELIIYRRSQFTDAGLAHLKGLTNLSKIVLCYARITDAGLAHLKALNKLSELDLQGTLITGAGLAHIKRLTKLSVLRLNDTQVTDAGLAHLEGLTELSELDLLDTQITDAGLAHLKRLSKLKLLRLQDNLLTHDGMEELKRALPNLTITR